MRARDGVMRPRWTVAQLEWAELHARKRAERAEAQLAEVREFATTQDDLPPWARRWLLAILEGEQ